MILHKILTLPLLLPFPATAQMPTVCSRRCSPENRIYSLMKYEKESYTFENKTYEKGTMRTSKVTITELNEDKEGCAKKSHPVHTSRKRIHHHSRNLIH